MTVQLVNAACGGVLNGGHSSAYLSRPSGGRDADLWVCTVYPYPTVPSGWTYHGDTAAGRVMSRDYAGGEQTFFFSNTVRSYVTSALYRDPHGRCKVERTMPGMESGANQTFWLVQAEQMPDNDMLYMAFVRSPGMPQDGNIGYFDNMTRNSSGGDTTPGNACAGLFSKYSRYATVQPTHGGYGASGYTFSDVWPASGGYLIRRTTQPPTNRGRASVHRGRIGRTVL